jgi:hypothetical protein
MNVEDRHTAATRRLGRTWTREEEWYNFQPNPREDVHVLRREHIRPRGHSVPGGSPGTAAKRTTRQAPGAASLEAPPPA